MLVVEFSIKWFPLFTIFSDCGPIGQAFVHRVKDLNSSAAGKLDNLLKSFEALDLFSNESTSSCLTLARSEVVHWVKTFGFDSGRLFAKLFLCCSTS